MVNGRIAGVTDVDPGDVITLSISGITQDEPVNGEADGNTSPDATIGSGGAFQVRCRTFRDRATDASTGSRSRASDGEGGTCSGIGRIGVPHDQGGQPAPVDSAPPSFNSLLP